MTFNLLSVFPSQHMKLEILASCNKSGRLVCTMCIMCSIKLFFTVCTEFPFTGMYLPGRRKINIIVVSHLSPELSVFGNPGYEIQKELIEYFAVLEIAIM